MNRYDPRCVILESCVGVGEPGICGFGRYGFCGLGGKYDGNCGLAKFDGACWPHGKTPVGFALLKYVIGKLINGLIGYCGVSGWIVGGCEM